VKADDEVNLENIGFHRQNFLISWDACSMHDEEVMTAEMADFKASGAHHHGPHANSLSCMDIMELAQNPDSRGMNLDFDREVLDRGFNVAHDCFGHDYQLTVENPARLLVQE